MVTGGHGAQPVTAGYQERAKRRSRSPWASKRAPLTTPQATAIGREQPGINLPRQEQQGAERDLQSTEHTRPPRVQRCPNRSGAD
jgi:hypothetical protein